MSNISEPYLFAVKNFKAIIADPQEESDYMKKGYVMPSLGDLTIFLGYRGVGKSSMLEALRLLSLAARHYEEYDNLNVTFSDKKGCRINESKLKGRFIINDKEQLMHHIINKFSKERKFEIILYSGLKYFGIYGSYNGYTCNLDLVSTKHAREIIGSEEEPEIDSSIVPFVHLISIKRIFPATTEKERVETTIEYEAVRRDGVGAEGENVTNILSWSNVFSDPNTQFWHDIIEDFKKYLSEVARTGEGKEILDIKIDIKEQQLVVNEKAESEGSTKEEAYIPFNYLSMGTRNLISMLLEASIAEKLAENGEEVVVAIEEPEIALHPSSLQGLIRILAEIPNRNKNRIRFILTTHSLRLISAIVGLMKESANLDIRMYHFSRQGKYISVDEFGTAQTIYNDITFTALRNEIELIFDILSYGK
ncbi:hypothetical protein PYJP_06320 [Pyrofollis japonicus]|uniref:AAA family ATPase n=1 Tax=Pyrofollis japonicus TaxID=3060460 RepID=UPI00295C1F5E|nr:AAA family ATPase [Pyrofollis japonicus]BEP17280.1 hypothetical protein PYJP_06320 [Pyrofollis japonicus]